MIRRTAVRGIILDGRKLLMVYSPVNGDYKFPGGGVDEGETDPQALAREIQEECGAQVASIGAAFGMMIEYDIPVEPDFDVFKMDSHYYFCQVTPGSGAQKLDDYEQELGFQPVWIDIDEAIRTNQAVLESVPRRSPEWTRRDTYVLQRIRQQLNDRGFVA